MGGGNSNIFGIFTPKIGETIQFDEHIFQRGWFNHQLVDVYCWMIFRGRDLELTKKDVHDL